MRFRLTVLALVLGTLVPAAAAADRVPASGGACDGWAQLRRVEADGTRVDGDVRGSFHTLIDPRTGRASERWREGPFALAAGFDGSTAWSRDRSGTTLVHDADHAKRVAVTDAWLERRGWCSPQQVATTPPIERSRGGRRFDVVVATPHGGVPVELWFDHATHLPDHAVTRRNENDLVVRYDDWRTVDGVVLPFVRTTTDPQDADTETVTLRTVNVGRPPAAAVAFAPPPTVRDVVMARNARSTTVPIRFEGRKILVDVMLNGRGPFPFVLDTGGHFIVTPATLRKLGAHAAGNEAAISELRIGGATIRNNVAHVVPYSFGRLERGPRPPKAGWLGLELFARFAAVIDPRTKTLTLTLPQWFTPPRIGTRSTLSFDEDAPLVPCRIDGFPGPCMIDTGNAGSTIVEGYWIRRSGRAPHFAGGLDAGDGVRLRRARIELGSLWLPHEIVAAFPQAVSGSESTTVEAAILSESIHERFVTTIDFRHRAMWLAPVAPASTIFNRTGLTFRKRRDGDLDVPFVYARSPGATAGIRAGDRVTAIDGRPASELSAADALEANLAAVGTIRSYRVVRGNEPPRVVRVRLAELLP